MDGGSLTSNNFLRHLPPIPQIKPGTRITQPQTAVSVRRTVARLIVSPDTIAAGVVVLVAMMAMARRGPLLETAMVGAVFQLVVIRFVIQGIVQALMLTLRHGIAMRLRVGVSTMVRSMR